MNTTTLRSLIDKQLDARWSEWAARHPHLAAAIDRVVLTDRAVELLREDPTFIEAMKQADLDEARLKDAARVLSLAEGLVKRLLP